MNLKKIKLEPAIIWKLVTFSIDHNIDVNFDWLIDHNMITLIDHNIDVQYVYIISFPVLSN